MDSRTFWIIFASTAVAGIWRVAWSAYKAKKMKEPVTMRLRDGVYEPWGFEQRWAVWSKRIGTFWLIYFVLLFGFLGAGMLGLVEGY